MNTMCRVYMPSRVDRDTHVAQLEDARELVEAVRDDLPRNGAAYDRADQAVHDITELLRGLR